MRVLVTGGSGQLGYDICRELTLRGVTFCAPTLDEMDITDRAAVCETVCGYAPDIVIHCAAYTKVDMAESEPQECWQTNAEGTQNVALACRQAAAAMVYISTDYVFPGAGEGFYRPEDPTLPTGVYARSKLAGELAVQTLLERYFIVRVSWMFGSHGSNFVETILRLAKTHPQLRVVCDQVGSPTYSRDAAALLCDMIKTDAYGIYHVTNEGTCSWAEFAAAIVSGTEDPAEIIPIPTAEYPAAAVRPLNSRLSKEKLDEMGFGRLPEWRDALCRYMKER